MTGVQTCALPICPDPDKPGWVYGRAFVSPLKAAVLLNWGQVGIDQIYDAAVETQTHFNIEIMVGDTLINEEVRTE